MRGLPCCLMLTEPSHTSIVELADPLGKDSSLVRAWYVEIGGPTFVGFIPLGTVRVQDFVVLDVPFQHLNLGTKSHCLPVVGLLGVVDSANSSTQYSSESGGIQIGNVLEENVQ